MNKDNACSALCEGKVEMTLSADQSNLLRRRIHEDYHVHLLVDNLPVVTPYKLPKTGEIFYDHGYRVGWEESDGKIFVNNHLDIILRYHKPTADAFRVVGFEAHTRSVDSSSYEFGNGPVILNG
jgi:transmembrane 9 superfamily protein 2/4